MRIYQLICSHVLWFAESGREVVTPPLKRVVQTVEARSSQRKFSETKEHIDISHLSQWRSSRTTAGDKSIVSTAPVLTRSTSVTTSQKDEGKSVRETKGRIYLQSTLIDVTKTASFLSSLVSGGSVATVKSFIET